MNGIFTPVDSLSSIQSQPQDVPLEVSPTGTFRTFTNLSGSTLSGTIKLQMVARLYLNKGFFFFFFAFSINSPWRISHECIQREVKMKSSYYDCLSHLFMQYARKLSYFLNLLNHFKFIIESYCVCPTFDLGHQITPRSCWAAQVTQPLVISWSGSESSSKTQQQDKTCFSKGNWCLLKGLWHYSKNLRESLFRFSYCGFSYCGLPETPHSITNHWTSASTESAES